MPSIYRKRKRGPEMAPPEVTELDVDVAGTQPETKRTAEAQAQIGRVAGAQTPEEVAAAQAQNKAERDAEIARLQGESAASQQRTAAITAEDQQREAEHQATLQARAALVNAPTAAEMDRKARLAADAEAAQARQRSSGYPFLTSAATGGALPLTGPAAAGARAREREIALAHNVTPHFPDIGPPTGPPTPWQPETMQAIVGRTANAEEAPLHILRAEEIEKQIASLDPKSPDYSQRREELVAEARREREVAHALRVGGTLSAPQMEQRQKVGGLGPDTGAVARSTIGGGPGKYIGGLVPGAKVISKVENTASVHRQDAERYRTRAVTYEMQADAAAAAGDWRTADAANEHATQLRLNAQALMAEADRVVKAGREEAITAGRAPSAETMRIISSLEAGTMFTGAGPSEAVPAMQEAPRMRTPQGRRMAEVLNARRKTMTDAMYTRALKELQQREDAGHYGPATEEVGIPGMAATGRGGGISNQPAPHIFWRQDGKPFMQIQDSRGPRLVEVPMEEAGGAGPGQGRMTVGQKMDLALKMYEATGHAEPLEFYMTQVDRMEAGQPPLASKTTMQKSGDILGQIGQYIAGLVASGSPSAATAALGAATSPTPLATEELPASAVPPTSPVPPSPAPPVVAPVIPPATPSPPAPPGTMTVGQVVGQTQAGAWAGKTLAEFTAALRANPQDPVLRSLGVALAAAGY